MRGVVTWLCLCCFMVVLLNTSATLAGPLRRLFAANRATVVEETITEETITKETIAEATEKLKDWRNLPKEEEKRLAKIVDKPSLDKAIRQEFSTGSCGMACMAGGSQLFDVFPDGTVKLAKEQPAEAPDEGVHGGGLRVFRGRR